MRWKIRNIFDLWPDNRWFAWWPIEVWTLNKGYIMIWLEFIYRYEGRGPNGFEWRYYDYDPKQLREEI